jgi:hypothetical protein
MKRQPGPGRPTAPLFKLPQNVTARLVVENKRLHDRAAQLMTEIAALRPVFDAAAGSPAQLQDAVLRASQYLGAPIQSDLAPEQYRRMIIFYIDWARECHAPMSAIYRFFATDPQQVRDWRARLGRGRPVKMTPGRLPNSVMVSRDPMLGALAPVPHLAGEESQPLPPRVLMPQGYQDNRAPRPEPQAQVQEQAQERTQSQPSSLEDLLFQFKSGGES